MTEKILLAFIAGLLFWLIALVSGFAWVWIRSKMLSNPTPIYAIVQTAPEQDRVDSAIVPRP